MLEKGTIINDTYRIDDKIGAGGGGTVFKAYHLRLEKYVVVKRINDAWVGLMDSRREADIIKNLKHQYLPQAYDFLRLENGIYTVMDFVPGASLDKYIKSGYSFGQQQILYWTKQAAEALVYLHEQNPPIIHSDIKPANIMIDLEGNICLIDFNVSLTSTPDSSISATSRGYAAPEQYLNQKPINIPAPGVPFEPEYNFGMKTPLDQRSDIYSLGATLYHLMTGQRPPKLPEEKLPEIPSDLQGYDEALIDIVNKMTRYDPRERYQTAQELLDDLNNITKLDKRYIRHRRARIAVNVIFPVIMAGAVLLGLAGYLQMNKEDDSRFDQKISYALNLAEKSDYENAEKAYQEAIDMRGDSIEGYYGILKMYSDRMDYDKVISYGNDTLSQHDFEGSTDKDRADFYYIIGNAYFEQENYDKAVEYYTKSTGLNTENPEYYRDFAIALARSAYVDKAKEMLEKATKLGLENDGIAVVKGEIAFAEGDFKSAAENFANAMKSTANSDLKQRACLYLCRSYYQQGKYDDVLKTVDDNISILNDARTRAANIMCGEACLKKAETAANDADRKNTALKAIEYYTRVKALGAVSKETDFNLATAYQYADDMENAQKILNEMQNEFPEDCDVYARLAILEADKQAKLPVASRKYDKFKNYYDRAIKLSLNNNDGTTSVYFQTMEQLMQRLKSGNWIKE